MDLIYENIPKGSTLRLFVIHSIVWTKSYWGSLNQAQGQDHLNREFLLEALPPLVVSGLSSKNMVRSDWVKMDLCQWHDHSGQGRKLRLESQKPQKETTEQSADAASGSSST